MQDLRRAAGIVLGIAALGTSALAGTPGQKGKLVRLNPRDPEPMLTKDFLDVTVSLRRGKLRVIRVAKGSFRRPRVLLRYQGRYQIRVYAHRRLLDLVRFSFPLTAAAGERTVPNIQLDRALARGVTAQTVVRVPFSKEVTRALLLDTRSGQQAPVDLRPWLIAPLHAPPAGPKRTSIFSR